MLAFCLSDLAHQIALVILITSIFIVIVHTHIHVVLSDTSNFVPLGFPYFFPYLTSG